MKTTNTTSVENGILTSAYKREIRRNAAITRAHSISRIKSLITNHEGSIESQTGVILQVSLFVFAIVLITF